MPGSTSGVDVGIYRAWALYWAATRPECSDYCSHDEVRLLSRNRDKHWQVRLDGKSPDYVGPKYGASNLVDGLRVCILAMRVQYVQGFVNLLPSSLFSSSAPSAFAWANIIAAHWCIFCLFESTQECLIPSLPPPRAGHKYGI